VTWYGLEIFKAEAQRVAQIGEADFANDKSGGDAERVGFRFCDVVGILYGHGPVSLARGRSGENDVVLKPRVSAFMCEDRDRAGYGKPGATKGALPDELVATGVASLAR
jgi:hypothetical protein